MSVMFETLRPSPVGGHSEIPSFSRITGEFAAIPAGARHLELLERAVTVALSPFDYTDVTTWGDALTLALCTLAGARAGAYLLPGTTVRWRALSIDETTGTGASWTLHDEATERLNDARVPELVVWARDDLATRDAKLAPSAARGTIGIRVRSLDGSVAAVCIHRDRSRAPASVHLLSAFRAIAPAFRAGIGAWTSAIASRANVSRMLDSLVDPALMFDVAGAIVHANPAAQQLTSSTSSARLRDEAQRVAWALGALARRRNQSRAGCRAGTETPSDAQSERQVHVGATVYRLRGSIVGEQLLGSDPAVLVTITSAAVEPMTDDTLKAEFGLTAREIEVARLMAEGLSNNEIAGRLGVRFFTARNHVERTLSKLGVASRHRVGPLLRNEQAISAAA
ncbi:MAG TPA: LuxR C-terminal-related transcriptional regulator [Gemmatimonadaceae bacterium]|nr:LuxR C-terminal-related transcriptional regulator [Gemmatimonadaceae bacterium]